VGMQVRCLRKQAAPTLPRNSVVSGKGVTDGGVTLEGECVHRLRLRISESFDVASRVGT